MLSKRSDLPGYLVGEGVPVVLGEFTGVATVAYRIATEVYYILNARNGQEDGPEVALTSDEVTFEDGQLVQLHSIDSLLQ